MTGIDMARRKAITIQNTIIQAPRRA